MKMGKKRADVVYGCLPNGAKCPKQQELNHKTKNCHVDFIFSQLMVLSYSAASTLNLKPNLNLDPNSYTNPDPNTNLNLILAIKEG